MRAEEFENRISQKQTQNVEGKGDKVTVKHGPWKGKQLLSSNCHLYLPYDECPRCGAWKYTYFKMVKARLLRRDSVLRQGHCVACKHVETVDGDPTKTGSLSHRGG